MKLKKTLNKIVGVIKNEIDIYKGKKKRDTHFSSSKVYIDELTAKEAFLEAKKLLFNVNKWSDFSGFNSSFSLYNIHGQHIEQLQPEIGFFIKIELPGPIPENWVKVVDIHEDENMAHFIVKPSYDPTKLENSNITAHFFKSNASSTFRIDRVKNKIIAQEIGKDEIINLDHPDRKILNTLIAEGGWAGFQKIQWKKLTDHLVDIKLASTLCNYYNKLL